MTEVQSSVKKTKEKVVDKASSPVSLGSVRLTGMIATSALIVAVVSAVMVVVSTENNQRLSQESTIYRAQLQKLQIDQQHMTAQLTQQQTAVQNALSGLEQLQLSLHKDPVGPVLNEVDYLLRLARYNAQYVGDLTMVLALLERAEQRIAAVSSPALAGLRAAIVNDISKFRGIKSVDVEGLLMRINALSETVTELPLVQQAAVHDRASALIIAAPEAENTWKEKLWATVEALKKVVVVHHLNEPVQPLIAPEQHSNLVGNLQLKLASAEWAVLHREPGVYSAALKQVKDWIGQYFVANDLSAGVLTGLDELGKIAIKPDLPDLAPTVTLLDEVMKAHQQLLNNTSIPISSPVSGVLGSTPAGDEAPAAGPQPVSGVKNPQVQHDVSPMPTHAPPLKAKPPAAIEPEVISS